ncbi:hypothetical protein THMIRHAM_15340 [Thiomicrorhabdus immobilis]|uniref:PilZ domain-containing protein n=1 Tax=Thiomicrorhabdus immobilis TaxID=2791037 RepID=A0ABM7MEB6_9GAMM|nr:hypothetical protein [Thiomicrorhabdus immobilis]BCN93749.1 hypothetical protein THMIRHAM_15340 [Thiomicrorhabdus immobilis]
MGAEKRTFFRFDVSLSYYLEPMNDQGCCLQAERSELLSNQEFQAIEDEKQQLDSLFQDSKHIQNGGVQLFDELNQKLDFMVWLLELILQGSGIHSLEEFQARKALNQKITPPMAKGSSKILPLLQGFFSRVDDYIAELIDVIEHGIHGKIFLYHKPVLKPFKIESYVKGLTELAQKGNWLARVITLLVSRLNHYEKLLANLKKAYRKLSDYEAWPIEKVNLGAGGFAVYTTKSYANAEKVCALFKMDDGFVFGEASCVYQSNTLNAEQQMRTAFQFDEISPEDCAHIVRFLMAKELEFHAKT